MRERAVVLALSASLMCAAVLSAHAQPTPGTATIEALNEKDLQAQKQAVKRLRSKQKKL